MLAMKAADKGIGVTQFCRRVVLVVMGWLLWCVPAWGQITPAELKPIFEEPTVTPDLFYYQTRHYLLQKIAPPPQAKSATEWTATAKNIRAKLLATLFQGWPQEWVTAPPKFQEIGVVETPFGYRIRRLRYEVVPGFYATAVLYEPTHLEGKVPAVLNVHGHEIVIGKAADYKQKRCINLAKRGMLVLNLEWIGTGELHQDGNSHWMGSQLDLIGVHNNGLFYLQMRKGLDYLCAHPHTDLARVGMTGMSGGGWQTILLSALDERVKVVIPVAGYASLQQRVQARDPGSIGDVEQMGFDMYDSVDYTHLTALLAPRPTLLIYNAEDDCCFRAAQARPLIFDAIGPIFNLYGKQGALEWYENQDPGIHNYEIDNREHAYGFFEKYLRWPGLPDEIPSDSEIRSYDELAVGLPVGNLTILDLARRIEKTIQRPPLPADRDVSSSWISSERSKLNALLHYNAVSLARPWLLANTNHRGIETFSYAFEMTNGLSANGVLAKSKSVPSQAPVTIVLDDRGKREAAPEALERLKRGEQVLALDLLFFGDAVHAADPASIETDPLPTAYMEVFHALGDRTVSLEVAQLLEISRWMMQTSGNHTVRLETRGIRSQTIALLAAALQRQTFSEIVVRNGMKSFGYLEEKPVEYDQAADLFCFGLYRDFDIDRLEKMAQGVTIVQKDMLTLKPSESAFAEHAVREGEWK